MRLSTFAFAFSAAFAGLSTTPASAQGVAYYAADGVHCYGGYVSTGDRCVPAASYYGAGGYYQGGGYYGGYRRRPRNYYSYDGAHCYNPYVSVGSRCVRAY